MTLEELETHPSSRAVSTAPLPKSTLPVQMVDIEARHVFWVVGDDGGAKRMIWTEDGRMVEVDEYGWGGD